MKNIKALRKGFFVVLLLAGIASDAFCIELSPAQRAELPPTVVPTVVNCPVEARFIGYNTPAGWQSNIPTMSICSAVIETSSSPNKEDVLYCRYGSSTCLSNSVLGALEKHVPNGSCKVNPDKRSFTCVQKIQ
jgi:hypothetical protein